jgi:hypothetical protein
MSVCECDWRWRVVLGTRPICADNHVVLESGFALTVQELLARFLMSA